MPELAAFYSVGFLACGLASLTFFWLAKRRRRSLVSKTLSLNLRKVDLYWSENLDQIQPWSEDLENKDFEASMRTILLTGCLLTFLSWAGLMFLLIIMLSYRFLARSRFDRLLTSSPLAANPAMSTQEIRSWLAENLH